ncbi:hypothetical protein I7I50_03091 [Histoplasma capsulatum G186AR]|uniref:Uncharacterized protein n=1 Tax=Ajellomyces capsulatus TaxID=5037 RepID=A0A8H7Z680_AJECA|nr:hypothetical protein I7I52_00243 [Histoplasma capsulatum]QSS72038.1 hypothetical protein I7I50_03091 [Histoplasma capsulatum G186AR]
MQICLEVDLEFFFRIHLKLPSSSGGLSDTGTAKTNGTLTLRLCYLAVLRRVITALSEALRASLNVPYILTFGARFSRRIPRCLTHVLPSCRWKRLEC